MSILKSSAPAHLSIFVTDPETGRPVARLPIYAEVAVPRIVPVPPINERYREPMRAELLEVDPSANDAAVLNRVETVALQALAETVDEASRNRLVTQPAQVKELFHLVFKAVLDAARRRRMAEIPPADLKTLMVAAVRRVAPELDLGLVPEVEDLGITWADPLGVLTTDHVGYVSFDLRRLRPDVQLMLAEAIEARRNDPDAVAKLAIWLYPAGHPGRFDALSQARFAFDAVVARLSMTWNTLPPALINMGPRALQNPSLTDWRLSPASFAASPKTLVGENGCEEMVPANLALQEFVLRQVVRLSDVPQGFGVPAGIKAAYVDEYKVSWFSLGHSLGEILYSLPLAPGETVKLAVIDWSWDSLTKRDEITKLTEEILHQTHRDRTITETVKAGLKELQHGSSFMGGAAGASGGSGGANLGVVGLGAAVGNTWSLGGSTATSDGSRDLAAENVQRLNDSFSQASSSQRELNSTVVIQARQEEKESIQTRTFSNYNHSHTLTVLYYEVLRHYRVTVEWVRRRPAVLLKLPVRLATLDDPTLVKHRFLLERFLLDPTLKGGFDALEKRDSIANHQTVHGINPAAPVPAPWWEGTVELELFEIGIWTNDDTINNITVYVVTAEDHARSKMHELHYVYKGSSAAGPNYDAHNINSGERMETDQEQFTFLKLQGQELNGESKRIPWSKVLGFQFEKWGNTEWRIDALSIRAWDRFGFVVDLTPGKVDVNLFILGREPGSQAFSGIKRPGPPPPTPAPVLSPDKSLSADEAYQLKRLRDHVAAHIDHYASVIQLGTNETQIARQFEAVPWTPGTMDDHVDPTPLDVFGSYVAYPLAKRLTGVDDTVVVDIAAALNGNDPARRQWAAGRLAAMSDADRQSVLERLPLASAKSERLNSMATRGVFAEGKLGHCNISEEIDNTRFWKWDEHPIPIEAPGINPVTPIQPQPQQVNAAPTAFPQSLVNIVNPSPAPDPAGLTAALSLLGTPNIFRDMSGKQEVADLLKKLSDNSIAIAEAANKAREIQSKYGVDLDKQAKDLQLGTTQAGAEVAKELVRQRREEAEKVSPSQAQDAIKLSESETRKGNKTPAEHKDYSKQVQQNVQGAKPARKSKTSIKLNVDLKGYGNNLIIGRFGIHVKQRGTVVGFLLATDYSRQGQLEVGVSNEYDDPRYSVEINGEVLGGIGINAELRGRDVVQIPREDFDTYDYFYLVATAEVGEFDYETTNSDEVSAEVAKRVGGGVEGSYKQIITMKTEGGVEWKDGKKHTSATAVKVKVAYYKGGFTIAYSKKP
jgi:hypothetical protein